MEICSFLWINLLSRKHYKNSKRIGYFKDFVEYYLHYGGVDISRWLPKGGYVLTKFGFVILRYILKWQHIDYLTD